MTIKAARVREDRVWRALADGTRRAMLDVLAERPLTTGEMVGRFPELCRTAVMKHLDVLVEAELVLVRREGRRRWNVLNPAPIQAVCDRWVSRHVRRIASAMGALRDVVEERQEQASGAAATARGRRPGGGGS